MRTSFKHLFQRTQQYGGFTNLWTTINLYKKQFVPVITWNKKHSLKQVGINDIHTWERLFLQLLLLKFCETFLFRQSNKVYNILWPVRVFFPFLEKRRPTDTGYGETFSFPYVDI